MQYSNILEKIKLVKEGKISLVENLQFYLKKIEERKNLNAFNFVFEKESLEQAKKIERKIISGKAGKLAGAVVAIKDVLAYKDHPLTCSSKILSNFISIYNATAIQKILDEDAIIIGKTNCDEFAMGSSNENSYFGKVLNPINENFVPGGSSGGSAAAVAANLCDIALGTDTGGSVRQPAAFCGIFGLKPTYGRISRFGLTAFASSFDTIGLFAKNIFDIALVLQIISGNDSKDSTSANEPVPDFIYNINPKQKFKIGIPVEYFADGLDQEIKNCILTEIEKLKQQGYTVEQVSLPMTEYNIATYYILTTAEASSNLARFDGARYGYRTKNYSNLQQMYINSRSEGFGQEVKRRIMLGTFVLSSGYYDAYYRKAQKVRRLIKDDFINVFNKFDLLITPTTPTTAFKLGEKSDNPLEMYLSDIYTTSANLAGIPGINIPISKSKNGLPIGMQVLAKHFDEVKLLSFASKFENIF